MTEAALKQIRTKRILIIHTDGNSFNNPSLKCIIDLLIERGCEIDLRYPKSEALMPTCYEGVRFLPFGRIVRWWKFQVFDRYCSRALAFFSVLIENFFYYHKYDLVIGVDRQGLIEAGILRKITQAPYVLISFEIMFEEETSAQYKSLEKEASKGLAAWIVQDEMRAEELRRENGLDHLSAILLPLASAGPGSGSAERLRDRLGIPRDKKVAIVIGSINRWAMITEIAKSVAEWPDEWVLIIHSRYGRTQEILAGETSAFAKLLDHRIYISNSATEAVDDMGSILAGISAGLAFYRPEAGRYDFGYHTGKNLSFLGLASGKISTYLRYGVPIIINEIGLYAEEARRFKFGCVVTQPAQIKDCFEEIARAEYGRNASGYFAKKLDFNLYREEIWSRLHAFLETS